MPSEQLVEKLDSRSLSAPSPTNQTASVQGAVRVTLNAAETIPSFPQKLLNAGFAVALVFAGACLIASALYLNSFLKSTDQGINNLISSASNNSTIPADTLYVAINARLAMAKAALLSCGVFIGMSFGFLGFALFLIGVKQDMNAAGSFEGYHIKLARLSPGVFVIVCATILVGVCVTHEIPFSFHYEATQDRGDQNSQPGETPKLPTIDNSRPKTR